MTMPIDLATVDWPYVGILSLGAFIAALLGSLIAFRNRFVGSILAGILFAVAFVFWTYYPHANIPGPIMLKPPLGASSAAGAPSAPSPAPVEPSPAPATPSPAPATPSPAPAAPSPAPSQPQ